MIVHFCACRPIPAHPNPTPNCSCLKHHAVPCSHAPTQSYTALLPVLCVVDGLMDADGPAMMVGKWLDEQGIAVKPSARPGTAPALVPVLAHKATEKLLAAVYAPWNDMENARHKPVKVSVSTTWLNKP